MADYTGSRRAVEPMSLADAAFAEDDAALTCPQCGAGVRPGQEWCSLCMHVFRRPEPEPQPEPQPEPRLTLEPQLPPEPEFQQTPEPLAGVEEAEGGPSAEARAQAEAAADALLAQLAVESHHNRLNVPEYLNSKSRVAIFVPVAMVVLCALGIATLAVLGSVFG